MCYPVTIPRLVKKWIYPDFVWDMPAIQKEVYLSFDDGPHPSITPFVLDQLKAWKAAASFFCIGNNVARYPEVYKRILMEGHTAGNHTYYHLNGWNSQDAVYFNDIAHAEKLIDSTMFRPPYGRITRFQAKQLREKWNYKIIMWSVLSGDFDRTLSPSDCLRNVMKNVAPGSIIVLHDSEKAFRNLEVILPQMLDQLTHQGFSFKKISL